jgi:hypothetical protein
VQKFLVSGEVTGEWVLKGNHRRHMHILMLPFKELKALTSQTVGEGESRKLRITKLPMEEWELEYDPEKDMEDEANGPTVEEEIELRQKHKLTRQHVQAACSKHSWCSSYLKRKELQYHLLKV